MMPRLLELWIQEEVDMESTSKDIWTKNTKNNKNKFNLKLYLTLNIKKYITFCKNMDSKLQKLQI